MTPRARPRSGPVGRAVAASLRATPPEKQDAGAVALAKAYAGLLDEAAAAETYAVHLRKIRKSLDREDPLAFAALDKIEAALSAHSVASDLGPKLLAALQALNLTPAARGREIKGVPARDPVADELAKLRDRRRRGPRVPDTEDLHPAAP